MTILPYMHQHVERNQGHTDYINYISTLIPLKCTRERERERTVQLNRCL
uniref:Uncharacterized protein n=1 Tax=Anguilla anguilla TaxID=7936 RepID=A0A0E9PY63_ANGAN